jgi:hypothetical protein
MASPAITPPNPAAGSQDPAAGGGAPPPGGGGSGDMAVFARVSMAAQQVTEQFPEAAQEMRQVMTLVRQATMKAIQQRSAAQPMQSTPQI